MIAEKNKSIMTEPHDYYDRDREPTSGIWGAILLGLLGVAGFIWGITQLVKLIISLFQ